MDAWNVFITKNSRDVVVFLCENLNQYALQIATELLKKKTKNKNMYITKKTNGDLVDMQRNTTAIKILALLNFDLSHMSTLKF